jgi:hypothetical protein
MLLLSLLSVKDLSLSLSLLLLHRLHLLLFLRRHHPRLTSSCSSSAGAAITCRGGRVG